MPILLVQVRHVCTCCVSWLNFPSILREHRKLIVIKNRAHGQLSLPPACHPSRRDPIFNPMGWSFWMLRVHEKISIIWEFGMRPELKESFRWMPRWRVRRPVLCHCKYNRNSVKLKCVKWSCQKNCFITIIFFRSYIRTFYRLLWAGAQYLVVKNKTNSNL